MADGDKNFSGGDGDGDGDKNFFRRWRWRWQEFFLAVTVTRSFFGGDGDGDGDKQFFGGDDDGVGDKIVWWRQYWLLIYLKDAENRWADFKFWKLV